MKALCTTRPWRFASFCTQYSTSYHKTAPHQPEVNDCLSSQRSRSKVTAICILKGDGIKYSWPSCRRLKRSRFVYLLKSALWIRRESCIQIRREIAQTFALLMRACSSFALLLLSLWGERISYWICVDLRFVSSSSNKEKENKYQCEGLTK